MVNVRILGLVNVRLANNLTPIFDGLDITYQRIRAALSTALNKHWQDLRGKKGKEGTHCLPLQTTSGRLGGNVTMFVDIRLFLENASNQAEK